VTREVAGAMSKLAGTLARVLAEALLGRRPAGERFPEGCDETTCFLRLNRYPACPISPGALGLVPHTDSDFLTVLCQDQQVGGLQLMKGDSWVAVKPIPGTLVVNIGDLFQVRARIVLHVAYICAAFSNLLASPPLLRADGSVGRDIVVVLVLATYWLLY
jgi:isopenicillin N synthase-like dioxygenase